MLWTYWLGTRAWINALSLRHFHGSRAAFGGLSKWPNGGRMATARTAMLQTAAASRGDRFAWLIAAALCGIAVLGLGGCSTVSEKLVEPMSNMPGIGMRAEVPERPAEAQPYPAVHDM